MEGSFTKVSKGGGRQCDVTVTKSTLKCVLKNSIAPNIQVEVNLSDILAIQTGARENSNVSSVIIHYAGRKKDKLLTWEKLVLAAEPGLCTELKDSFSLACPDGDRPRHFLVIVNPHSGTKTGSRIFHKKVAPLFKACGITFKVYETTRPNDARTAFQDVDLSTVQGVIAVGGDGFFSEVVTALVLKQQQLHQVNTDDPNCALVPVNVPVGVIPCGSGNYLAMYLHGIIDPITAAIKIVLGKTTATNLASIHIGGKLIRYAGLISCFGLIGNMMAMCERHRWMGNVRYKVFPLKGILTRKLVEAEVSYLKENGEWQVYNGPLYSVDLNVVNLADKNNKLVPVFGDSALTIHIASVCPLGEHIKQLSKVADWTTGAYDFNFLTNERVLRYKVSLTSLPTLRLETGEERLVDKLYMNLDGEALLIDRTSFDVSLQAGLIELFGDHPSSSAH
ncbi:sphingosine kinase 1 [Biomphalaria pfeifferi]|uniref:Sphingosine kinase 1 n=1 Tax=Biomphalaria pfeifferi TaxID=112525 RepID=A0AAD8CBK2_BIOPF|nr:sphingosine kinase 1 [Biomphalaria pfeifferi]